VQPALDQLTETRLGLSASAFDILAWNPMASGLDTGFAAYGVTGLAAG
jgi:hypothetical protein